MDSCSNRKGFIMRSGFTIRASSLFGNCLGRLSAGINGFCGNCEKFCLLPLS